MADKTTIRIFDVDVGEGDEIYSAKDLQADSEGQALMFMRILFAGQIDEFSEVISIKEKLIH
tara:strand:- start:446 stop:631 length:186 start_codon:yes stop_codon:yes gene_type:complete